MWRTIDPASVQQHADGYALVQLLLQVLHPVIVYVGGKRSHPHQVGLRFLGPLLQHLVDRLLGYPLESIQSPPSTILKRQCGPPEDTGTQSSIPFRRSLRPAQPCCRPRPGPQYLQGVPGEGERAQQLGYPPVLDEVPAQGLGLEAAPTGSSMPLIMRSVRTPNLTSAIISSRFWSPFSKKVLVMRTQIRRS